MTFASNPGRGRPITSVAIVESPRRNGKYSDTATGREGSPKLFKVDELAVFAAGGREELNDQGRGGLRRTKALRVFAGHGPLAHARTQRPGIKQIGADIGAVAFGRVGAHHGFERRLADGIAAPIRAKFVRCARGDEECAASIGRLE